MASADGVSGSPSDNRATAALTLKLTNEEAVVEVKEALKGGSSFVLLAIIRLPIINEACPSILRTVSGRLMRVHWHGYFVWSEWPSLCRVSP